MKSHPIIKKTIFCLLIIFLLSPVPNTVSAAPEMIGSRNENPGPFLSWPLSDTNQDNITRLPDTGWTHHFLGISSCGTYPSLIDAGSWYDGKNYSGNRHLILSGVSDKQVKWMNDGSSGVFNNAFACYKGHEGIDISQYNGTHVLAAASGTVVKTTSSRMTIKHANVNGSGQNWYTAYVHVTNMRYKVGDYVETGTWIANVGSGHLHFETLYNGIYSGNARNPYGIDSAPYDGCLWSNASLCPNSQAQIIPANQNIVIDGTFENSNLSKWWTWGDLPWAFYGDGVLYTKRNLNSSSGAFGQSFNYFAPANSPIEVSLQLGNNSNVTKTPGVHIKSGNNWDIQCWFTIPPHTPLQTYTVRGVNKSDWNGFNLEIWPDPPDGQPDVLVDNISLTYKPGLDLSGTECIVGTEQPEPEIPATTPDSAQAGSGFSDGFDNKTLNSGWTWVDPSGDSSYNLTDKPGSLRLSTPDGEHDLYMNLNAPRMLQPITGDFVLRTKVTVPAQYNYQGAGVLIWQDEDNYIRMEKTSFNLVAVWARINGEYTGDLVYSTEPNGVLKVERSGNTFKLWYQDTSQKWVLADTVEFSAPATLQVGLSLLNNWHDYPLYSDFEEFSLE